MKALAKFALLSSMVLISPVIWATPKDVFDSFKTFKGRWRIEASGKTLPIEMTYEDGSKGSIVTEQFGKELSVLFRDGNELLMNHYCNGGNQPRLKLKASSKPNQMEFETFEVSNLKSPQADYVKKIVYKVVDDKKMELEIVWKKGEGQEIEKYNLTKL